MVASATEINQTHSHLGEMFNFNICTPSEQHDLDIDVKHYMEVLKLLKYVFLNNGKSSQADFQRAMHLVRKSPSFDASIVPTVEASIARQNDKVTDLWQYKFLSCCLLHSTGEIMFFVNCSAFWSAESGYLVPKRAFLDLSGISVIRGVKSFRNKKSDEFNQVQAFVQYRDQAIKLIEAQLKDKYQLNSITRPHFVSKSEYLQSMEQLLQLDDSVKQLIRPGINLFIGKDYNAFDKNGNLSIPKFWYR